LTFPQDTDIKGGSAFKNREKLNPTLWLFASIEGVEPTNNHADRILRLGVSWRKNAFTTAPMWGLNGYLDYSD
jgi:hypothetical protein